MNTTILLWKVEWLVKHSSDVSSSAASQSRPPQIGHDNVVDRAAFFISTGEPQDEHDGRGWFGQTEEKEEEQQLEEEKVLEGPDSQESDEALSTSSYYFDFDVKLTGRPIPEKYPLELPVITSFASSDLMDTVRNFVGSVHHWHPEVTVHLYQISELTVREKSEISTWSKVELFPATDVLLTLSNDRSIPSSKGILHKLRHSLLSSPSSPSSSSSSDPRISTVVSAASAKGTVVLGDNSSSLLNEHLVIGIESKVGTSSRPIEQNAVSLGLDLGATTAALNSIHNPRPESGKLQEGPHGLTERQPSSSSASKLERGGSHSGEGGSNALGEGTEHNRYTHDDLASIAISSGFSNGTPLSQYDDDEEEEEEGQREDDGQGEEVVNRKQMSVAQSGTADVLLLGSDRGAATSELNEHARLSVSSAEKLHRLPTGRTADLAALSVAVDQVLGWIPLALYHACSTLPSSKPACLFLDPSTYIDGWIDNVFKALMRDGSYFLCREDDHSTTPNNLDARSRSRGCFVGVQGFVKGMKPFENLLSKHVQCALQEDCSESNSRRKTSNTTGSLVAHALLGNGNGGNVGIHNHNNDDHDDDDDSDHRQKWTEQEMLMEEGHATPTPNPTPDNWWGVSPDSELSVSCHARSQASITIANSDRHSILLAEKDERARRPALQMHKDHRQLQTHHEFHARTVIGYGQEVGSSLELADEEDWDGDLDELEGGTTAGTTGRRHVPGNSMLSPPSVTGQGSHLPLFSYSCSLVLREDVPGEIDYQSPLPDRINLGSVPVDKIIHLAVGIASTTWGSHLVSADSLPLLNILLPSLLANVDRNSDRYLYVLYLGYDVADAVFGDQQNMLLLRARVNALIQGYPVAFKTVRFPCSNRPTFVWNGLFGIAMEEGADYFFQAHDDTEFTLPRVPDWQWADALVRALRSNPLWENLGVAGPFDVRSPRAISHCFVHRTHMDIFGGLFPTSLGNKEHEEWVSRVYGYKNTFLLRQLPVNNWEKFSGRAQQCGKLVRVRRIQREIRKSADKIRAWVYHQVGRYHQGGEEIGHLFVSL
ncbi:hypothetical protein CBR_g44 [Chara braunii]|uniref:Uncharacterized protein n=1 Tax=Chara braunii TaxID=69332 RepID=A0A388JLL4_CHABU|nr:hypothetical protein CBR_g44 [Chara braunii]|eukprot:GBG58643.1 hypothetical protein CBR_g44 [Chara braunii]